MATTSKGHRPRDGSPRGGSPKSDCNRPQSCDRPRSCCGLPVPTAIAEIGLEPILFVQNVVTQMVFITSQDLMIQKACRVNHGLTTDVCSDLAEFDSTDDIIQDEVSEFLTWRQIFETTLQFAVVLFLGPWSDRWGRRTPLIMCMLLLMGESALMLLNAHMEHWPLEMMLICSVSYGLSGGHYTLLMLSFAHMADNSTRERRTFRIGLLDIMWYFGKSIGLVLKPLVVTLGGYDGIFGSAIVLYILAAVYVFFRLRGERPSSQPDQAGGRCQHCSLTHFSDSIAVVTKPRANRHRLYILLLIGVMVLDALMATGEGNVKYLFVLRAVKWSSAHYSNWYALSSFLTVVGGLLLVPLLTLRCPVHDAVLGLVGGVSSLAANLLYGPVNRPSEGLLLYIGSVLGSFSTLVPVAVRALLSKLAKQDVGSVFAVMAAAESLIPFVAGPVYLSLYSATNTHNPGVYNYLSAALHVVTMVMFGFIFYAMRRSTAEPDPPPHAEPPGGGEGTTEVEAGPSVAQ